MLKRIQLSNFKSWRNLDLELAPITVLFGTNSSGKSSVLQALLLLKQTIEGLDRQQVLNFGGTDRDLVDLGGFREIIYKHDIKKTIAVDIFYNDSAEYHAIWEYQNETVFLSSLSSYLNQSSKLVGQLEEGEWNNLLNGESYSIFKRPEQSYRFPDDFVGLDQYTAAFLELAQLSNSQIESFVGSIQHLKPIRDDPKRVYLWTGSSPGIVGSKGEYTIQILISSQNQKSGEITEEIARWLQKMELVEGFKVKPLETEKKRFYETLVTIGGTDVSILDSGFGVSQVLPVITLLFFAPEGSLILLEQPELHLHPGAQAQLADLILHVAEKRNLQLVIESHSEHLLRRFQRRIAEIDQEFASPKNIKMYFCEAGAEGSQIQEVKVDAYGQIENWPKNFFGDVSGDLDAMMQAGIERRLKELNGG